jgi:hypothetical protein
MLVRAAHAFKKTIGNKRGQSKVKLTRLVIMTVLLVLPYGLPIKLLPIVCTALLHNVERLFGFLVFLPVESGL